MKTSRFIWLSLAILLVAGGALAQSFPYEIEFGYRWTDITGNEALYRTQINERDGFLIRALTMYSTDFGGNASTMFDHFRLDVADLGSSPSGVLRIDAGKTGQYRLRVGYRAVDAYSALPGFAAPLSNELTTGQHTYDRARTMFDADIELLRWRSFTPFIGYSLNANDGPGRTTYQLGFDEFELLQDLDETDHEYRVGVGFNTRYLSGQVTQGLRRVKTRESLSLALGANAGNNINPILGRPISASDLTRRVDTEVDTPFTNLYVTSSPFSRLTLVGNFSQFSAETDGLENESATGSFVSFDIGRFFDTFDETVDARGKNDTWRGGARAEIGITDFIEFVASYQNEHRELEGTSLIRTMYGDSLTFSGIDRRDVEAIIRSENSVDRDEETINATVIARVVGPLSIRAGYTETRQDLTLTPDLSEIVVPGGQSGVFERKIDSYDVSANFAMKGFTGGLSLRRDEADQAVLRTDFIDRDRIRARFGYQAGDKFRIGLMAQEINQENDREGTGYDGEYRQYTADFEFAPVSMFRVRGAYSILEADSVVSIRRPESFAIEQSILTEDGEAYETGFSVVFKPVIFDADVARYDNAGSIPLRFDRYRVRGRYDFKERYGFTAEFSKDEYDEFSLLSSIATFDASRYGIYFRIKQ